MDQDSTNAEIRMSPSRRAHGRTTAVTRKISPHWPCCSRKQIKSGRDIFLTKRFPHQQNGAAVKMMD